MDYLANAIAGTDDTLTCSTCHLAAHNWSQPGWAALDPEWLPVDNGRNSDQALDMYNPDMSKTCMDCHYFMDGDGTSVSPTLGTSKGTITPEMDESEHYQAVDHSMGTHYIGVIHEESQEKWSTNPILDMFDVSGTWKEKGASQYSSGLAAGWSRFGGENRDGSRVIVCESCHELEPERNDGFTHMLLAPYEEGQNGNDEYPGDYDGMDILCVACHGKPAGSHPMTGDEVGSGGGHILDPYSPFVRDTILGYAHMDRRGGLLSCDTCHQPHDANTNSYTMMLDAPEEFKIGSKTVQGIGAGSLIPGYSQLVSESAYYPEANGQPDTYTTPRSADTKHHGLCLQCHDR